MNPAGLHDYAKRSAAVALKLKIVGRDIEAGRWQRVARVFGTRAAQ